MNWRRYFRRSRADAELLQEIELHMAEEVDENIARGMAPNEARRRAHLKFGNPQQIRENLWQQNTPAVIEGIWRDLKCAARALARSPGFALVAILVMGLGIGANVTLFTVVRSVLLKPLPYRDPGQLFTIYEHERVSQNFAYMPVDAGTETLYDQPYEDNNRLRVCGPFSVESLSPHRVLSTAGENQNGTLSEQEAREQQDFATMILDNLKKAGVQNTRKTERLTFERLDPYAGSWLNAASEYTDVDGKRRRVAVTIGPEHGTVGPQQVKEAAKEAVQGLGFDMLVVCGFAFDPHVAEEVKRYGKLIVLPTRMNPDLAMGDELLKKTGAGNLFMVFGEPDVEIKKQKNGQLVAEIKGVDVYDPTTGQIRSASTGDIACWFIDTDYNSESFFVRHTYFTGAEEPYDRLKRALRADIDEAAWSALYSTVSRPFGKPKSGKIAIKVINHYGDEVLKVFQI